MAKNKVKSLFALKGYTIRNFCLEHDWDYNGFLRRINLGLIKISEIEYIAIQFKMTPAEVVEFFLPNVFENIKHEA